MTYIYLDENKRVVGYASFIADMYDIEYLPSKEDEEPKIKETLKDEYKESDTFKHIATDKLPKGFLDNPTEYSFVKGKLKHEGVPPLELEVAISMAKKKIQDELDKKAQEFGFDDMFTARGYAGFDNEFKDIAVSLGQWASKMWVYAEAEMIKFKGKDITEDIINKTIAKAPKYKGLK